MGDKTSIEWAGLGFVDKATWNPIIARRKSDNKRGWFCIRRNSDCINCYAATRNMNTFYGNGYDYAAQNLKHVTIETINLDQPLHWQKPRGIFVCSMTDLFGDFVTDTMRDQVMDTCERATHHRFALLTKRFGFETLNYLAKRYGNRNGRTWPPHVWLGVTAGHQQAADEALPFMFAVRRLLGPQAVLWISDEPATGPIDWSGWAGVINWLVTGGESGTNARPMHPDWARTARDWANANHIAFHFKQWGEWLPYGQEPGTRDRTGLRVHEWTGFDSYRVGKHAAGRTLDGRTWDEFPVKDDGHA